MPTYFPIYLDQCENRFHEWFQSILEEQKQQETSIVDEYSLKRQKSMRFYTQFSKDVFKFLEQ